MNTIWRYMTEPYWRIKWYWWLLVRSPLSPSVYNTLHQHQITSADYDIMVKRWEVEEPARGVPPAVLKHRERMTKLWGPDKEKWRWVPDDT